MKYKPSDKVRGMLNDLFYYYGYSCGYQGIPDFTSRLWFNYVQCEAIFDIETTETILPVYLDDLKSRLKEGVTCMHRNAVLLAIWYKNYDFDQTKENYERWILGL